MELGSELMALQAQWRGARRAEQEHLYAGPLGDASVAAFRKRPLSNSDFDTRPRLRGLVSVLGFSWQPVALLSAWADPELVLVLGTEQSLSHSVGGESVGSVIVRVSGLPESRFRFLALPEDDEATVYQAVREFASERDFGPGEVYVDPTGGKKSFSAAAALAGFMLKAPLVYVDYTEYDAIARIPVPGTEYPRLLRNPLEVFGETELARVRSCFDAGQFEEARYRAEDLAERLHNGREASLLGKLATGYGAWSEKYLEEALKSLEGVLAQLHCMQVAVAMWPWVEGLDEHLRVHCSLLRRVIEACGGGTDRRAALLPVLNQVAAARRAADRSDWIFALTTLHSAFEWYLIRRLEIDFGLSKDKDCQVLIESCRERFHEIGPLLHGEKYIRSVDKNPLGQLMFARALQLLATLAPGEMDSKHDLKSLMRFASLRNNSDIAHIRDLSPRISPGDFEDCFQLIIGILSRCPGIAPVDALLEEFRFPRLSGNS